MHGGSNNTKMATEVIGKIKRAYSVAHQLTVASLYLTAQDIGTWKNAINSARSETNPWREQLLRLYNNIILDGHLTSVMNKRRMAITNKNLVFIPEDDREVPDGLYNNILDTPWMNNILGWSAEQVSWGHSLIELIPVQGVVADAALIDRLNVRPELGFLMWDYRQRETGINYRTDPYYSRYLIEVGAPKDYGLLMQAAQYAIYKRGGFGDWAEFAEIFGMPFREGRYNPYDPESREKLVEAMTNMGSAGWTVIPEGTSIQFHNPSQATQSSIFLDLIKECNSEMSKLFLGQTMTTDNGSSKSQSQTHKEVEDEINASDMIRIEHVLNWDFKKRMISLGATELEKGSIRFHNTTEMAMDKRIEIDVKINEQLRKNGKTLPDEYWEETYGIPNPIDAPAPVKVEPGPNSGGSEKKDPKLQAIARMYAGAAHNTIRAAGSNYDKVWARIIKGIHSGQIKKGDIDPELFAWIKEQLMQAVADGFGELADYAEDSVDYAMLQKLHNNVHVFSGHKTYQELRAATKLLVDGDGKLLPFSKFKSAMLSLGKEFNEVYLQTEYEMAVASSQMADKWLGFEKDKDTFPLLKYVTVGDAAVRASHQALNGIIKPVDDPFWDTHYPPNAWGCRCNVQQLAKGKVSSRTDFDNPPTMFNNNVGKTGVIFPKSHPYYKVDQEDKASVKQHLKDLE